ncbi:MAG: UDP-N-acetylmuramate dehydrogenase [Candidatus Hydrogenedens sp.]|nr:UDP-N-acetylmuramate dehydrogenase [Candidatus Hydrogenedens sp.]
MSLPLAPYIIENAPLAPHCFYRIGGPARWGLFPRSLEEMEEAYKWIKGKNIPFMVLGGGTNVLISDSGYDGAVLFTGGLDYIRQRGKERFDVGAGTLLAEMVSKVLLPNNYTGTGALTGIPGSVGGALFMNAGTVNGSICQMAESVRLLSETGLTEWEITEKDYSYRGQRYCPTGTVILEGRFHFTVDENDQRTVYEHYLDRRRNTQPQGRCCGSVFKNPEGDHAGRLIEECGLKGTRLGGAVISEKHANFIVNEADASFDDVYGLISLAKARVKERFGMELTEEVRIIKD